jgi:hypothetical protein
MPAPELLRLVWVCAASLGCVFGAEFATGTMTATGHGPPGGGPPLRVLVGGDVHDRHGVSRTADEGWWRRLAPRTSGDTRLANTSRKEYAYDKEKCPAGLSGLCHVLLEF